MVVEPEVVATVEKIVLTTPPNQQRKQQQQQMVTLKRKTTNLKGYLLTVRKIGVGECVRTPPMQRKTALISNILLGQL
jgi:hypothetical protein